MEKMLNSLVALTLLAGCDGARVGSATMPSRPVTVIELAERDYGRERELTGVVRLYREEDIGFEIGGRVTTVLDEGLEVRGPAFDEKGELVRKGDPIAAMEGTRYGSEVGALQAQLEAAHRDLQAVEAQLILASQVLERKRNLVSEGAGAEQALDDAQSTFDQATAQLAARRAAVRAAGERLARATEDLGDSVLYAPFSGRVTAVHISEGAVVSAGMPIVTLTLMDPVRVQIEVSADDERVLETGDRALILPKDPFDPNHLIPVNGIVFEKSAVADPRFTILTRRQSSQGERADATMFFNHVEVVEVIQTDRQAFRLRRLRDAADAFQQVRKLLGVTPNTRHAEAFVELRIETFEGGGD